jgi:hypothetical protein
MLVDLKQQQQQHHLPPQISHAGNNTWGQWLILPTMGGVSPLDLTKRC